MYGPQVGSTKAGLQSLRYPRYLRYFERPPERIAESALAKLEDLHVRAITRSSSLLYTATTVPGSSTLFIATLIHCDRTCGTTLASHESLSHLQQSLFGTGSANSVICPQYSQHLPHYVVARTNSLLATHFDGMKPDCNSWQPISDPFSVNLYRSTKCPIAHDTDVPVAMAWAAGAGAALQYYLCGNSLGCASMTATQKSPPWSGTLA